MKPRPLGITIMAVLLFVNVATYAVLAALSLLNTQALTAILRVLSPGGSGPAGVHLGMGKFLPVYYVFSMVLVGWVAMGFWKLWNWSRILVLAMIGLSLVFLLGTEIAVASSGSAAAITLFLVRLGLCLLVGWYLLSRNIRNAFRPNGDREQLKTRSASNGD